MLACLLTSFVLAAVPAVPDCCGAKPGQTARRHCESDPCPDARCQAHGGGDCQCKTRVVAKAKSETDEGWVNSVTVQPGSPKLMVGLFVDGERAERPSQYVLPDETGSDVTFDGKKVNAAELAAKLVSAKGRVWVVLHPLAERYGASLKAEFTTKPKAKP